ncbi:MAG: hypothetical protein V1709_05365 [Planctomycetota bacterium]
MIKIIILIILLLILALPFILLTNWSLETAENYIGKNSQESWTADWQWRIANIYFWTFREDKAIKSYDNFMKHYPKDKRYPDAKFKKACCMAKVRPKEYAISEFNEFADWYPEHPNASEARKRATLLKYAY